MEYYDDEWPKIQDVTDFDGKNLLTLVRNGNSPFVWDVNLLIQEVEENLATQVINIPVVSRGSDYYVRRNSLNFFESKLMLPCAQGIHLKLSNLPDVVARLSCRDVNIPNYCGFPIGYLVSEVKFEAAVYEILRSDASILSWLLDSSTTVSRFMYLPDLMFLKILLVVHCSCLKGQGEKKIFPEGEEVRLYPHVNRLFVLNKFGSIQLLTRSLEVSSYSGSPYLCITFNFDLPVKFTTDWFLQRLFEHKPKSFPIPEATVGNIGDMIGWECDNATVGPIAAAAKQSLLQLIPHIIPLHDDGKALYRLVLKHGDLGIHNMSITKDENGLPLVTSVHDWETACIVPAKLSDPLMGG